jgi:Glycosyltransferase family 87
MLWRSVGRSRISPAAGWPAAPHATDRAPWLRAWRLPPRLHRLLSARAVGEEARRVGSRANGGVAAHLERRISAASARLLVRLTQIPVWLQAVAGALLVVFYAERIWTVYVDTGLFRRLGFDWGLFYSQASALAAGDVAAMYQVERLGQYVQRLAVYTTFPEAPLLQWPSPYPPLLAGALLPFTRIPPPVAFGIWTALSAASACHLLWRVGQLVPGGGRLRLAVIFFTTLPVLQAFVLGQPVLFLASALAESYMALRRGADLRGGLWLGLLALKPQYGLLLGAFLLWKRRWRGAAGAIVSVAAVLGASAAVAGPGAVWDYATAVSAMGDFRDVYAAPAEMVNWRALIVNARPAIGNTSGVLLFLALSGLTIGAIAWAARGAWRPGKRTLDWQLTAVVTGTFLVSYHSHMHGLVLLTVPLAALWRISTQAPAVRMAILGFVFLPTAAFIGVAAVGHGFAINYDDPLWVVWPVWNVTLLVMLLAVTLLTLRTAPDT